MNEGPMATTQRASAAEPAVRRAVPGDISALASVLSRAFDGDPFYRFLAGDAPERHARMYEGWLGILRFASADLRETWTTDDRAGVAVWLPPGDCGPGVLDGFRLLPAMARLAGWRRLREISAATDALERRRRHHVPGAHFYLSVLGVEPGRQGEGMGTALVAPVLERCDAERVAAYLETAVARNVLLYERLGFDVVEEMVLPRTDIHGWLMRRSPRDRARREPDPPAGGRP
jgi:ribosomal protein S18 acetylase RimI-like enzyme